MKKVFAILLATALVATLSVVAFAETQTITVPFTSEEKTLSVSYEASTDLEVVYGVDIEWDSDLEFDYSAGNAGVWNPADHSVSGKVDAGWQDNTCNVSVTNHSNAAIWVEVLITDSDEDDGVTFTTGAAVDLGTAYGYTYDQKTPYTFTITAEGTPTGAIADAATATLKISEYTGE